MSVDNDVTYPESEQPSAIDGSWGLCRYVLTL